MIARDDNYAFWQNEYAVQEDSGKSILYLQGSGGIIAPENCIFLFKFAKEEYVGGGEFADIGYINEIIGLEYLDTNSVTNMSHMFSDCTNLSNLDVSNFNQAAAW